MKSKAWLPYVAPMAIYMAFLAVQTDANLMWMYPLKTIVVAAVLWFFRREYEELRSSMRFCCVRRGSPDRPDLDRPQGLERAGSGDPRTTSSDVRGQETRAQQTETLTTAAKMAALQSWLLAVIVGLVVIVIWIGSDSFYPKFGRAKLFDPTTIASLAQRNVFIVFRIVGAVLVVPVMEELFWRAFLIRWLVKEDFKSVAVGTFTLQSFAITVALFGAEHYQWLAGLICGALYNWLYYKRKDVFACVVAHAVSNAALAAWVLARGDWKFW